MKQSQKLKNLLDIEYQTKLNEQTTFLVLLGTAIITIFVSNWDKTLKTQAILILIVLFLFVIGFYRISLRKTKSKIENLTV